MGNNNKNKLGMTNIENVPRLTCKNSRATPLTFYADPLTYKNQALQHVVQEGIPEALH